MGWYSEVSRDVAKIPQAVAYFENEIIEDALQQNEFEFYETN